MPDADTVWLTPLTEVVASLGRAGLEVAWTEECSASHLAVVEAMIAALDADHRSITAQVGTRAFDDLRGAHVLWSDWLRTGRVRKFAVVAERVG